MGKGNREDGGQHKSKLSLAVMSIATDVNQKLCGFQQAVIRYLCNHLRSTRQNGMLKQRLGLPPLCDMGPSALVYPNREQRKLKREADMVTELNEVVECSCEQGTLARRILKPAKMDRLPWWPKGKPWSRWLSRWAAAS